MQEVVINIGLMCGYKDQDQASMKFEANHLKKRKWPLALAEADWLQQEEYGDYIEVAHHVPPPLVRESFRVQD